MNNLEEEMKKLLEELDKQTKEAEESIRKGEELKKAAEENKRKLAEKLIVTREEKVEENEHNEKTTKDGKNRFLKALALLASAIVIFTGGYHICKYSKKEDKSHAQTSDEPYVADNEYALTGNEEVLTIVPVPTKEPVIVVTSNPTVAPTQKPVTVVTSNPTVAPTQKPVIVVTSNPTAAPTENVYVNNKLTDEVMEELTVNLYNELRSMNLNVKIEDVRKLVTIINIDTLNEENPSYVANLLGNSTPEEFITDAFNITSAIKSKNYDIFASTKSAAGLIKLSPYIYRESDRRDLEVFENTVSTSADWYGDRDEQNAIVADLVYNIQNPEGNLFDMEDGVRFASTITVDLLINSTTRNESNEELLGKAQSSALLNYDTMEGCLSNIFGYLRRVCDTKVKKY